MDKKDCKDIAQALKEIHDMTAIEIATKDTSDPVIEEVFKKARDNWLAVIRVLST